MSSQLLDVGPLELEVLGVLNSHPDQCVADIQKSLKSSGHDLAYTTVMTVLVRLHKKNLVTRQKEGRQFLYSAAHKKDSTPLRIFERVKNSLFRSEKLLPIMSLLDSDQDLTQEELEQLKKAVDARLQSKKRSL